MRHGSLFSGIGGFDLAAQWMGWTNVFQVEIDGYCQKVLQKNFPNVKRYGDIREFDGTQYKGRVDIISGGFPCQNISSSGNMEGINGSKSSLWFSMLNVIRQIKPGFVCIENSPNLLKKGFEQVLWTLSEEGYNVEWQCLQASDVGKPHERERAFVVAYSNSFGFIEASFFKGINSEKHSKRASITASGTFDFNGRTYPSIPKNLLLDDGVSYELDSIGGYGNAIVPQVAYEIFKAIEKSQGKLELKHDC